MAFNYTTEQINELRACLADPAYFYKVYCRVQPAFTRGIMSVNPSEEQIDLLREYANGRNHVVLGARQAGLTTLNVAIALWDFLFVPQASIALIAHKGTGPRDQMRDIFMRMYTSLPEFFTAGDTFTTNNKDVIASDRGGRVFFKSGKNDSSFRGLSLTRAIVNDAAFLSDMELHELIQVLLHVGHKGGLIVTSGLNNLDDGGIFINLYEQAEKGEVPNWDAHHLTWKAVDREEGFEEVMKKNLGKDAWRREYECQWKPDGEA